MGVPRASSPPPSFSSVRGRFSGVASLSEPAAERREQIGEGEVRVGAESGAGRAELVAARGGGGYLSPVDVLWMCRVCLELFVWTTRLQMDKKKKKKHMKKKRCETFRDI